jgi:hypothetical protein
VASAHGTIVAAGYSGPTGNLDAAVWSADANASGWIRVPDPGVFDGPGDQVINRVEAIGTQFVAVGYDTSSGDSDAAVWVSADGTHWSSPPAATGALGGPGGQHMRSVTQFGSRLVAVGFDRPDGGDDQAAVWVADGGVWRRIPFQPSFGGPGDQQMASVVAGGPGLVAVGFTGTSAGADAAVWVSSDGSTWDLLPSVPEVFGGTGAQGMLGVALTPAGIIAVGNDDGDGAVWRSQDGATWTKEPTDPALGGSGGQVARGVAFGRGLVVVVGKDGPEGSDAEAAVWTAPILG